jgi:hypothetical protein
MTAETSDFNPRRYLSGHLDGLLEGRLSRQEVLEQISQLDYSPQPIISPWRGIPGVVHDSMRLTAGPDPFKPGSEELGWFIRRHELVAWSRALQGDPDERPLRDGWSALGLAGWPYRQGEMLGCIRVDDVWFSNDDDRLPPFSERWEIWRMDDNGSSFLHSRYLTREAAERRCARLSETVHKQHYWVEERARGDAQPTS